MKKRQDPPTTLAEEIMAAREAIRDILRSGPFHTSPETIAGVDKMSDVEVLKLKYELRDLLRAIATLNDAMGRPGRRRRAPTVPPEEPA